MVDFGGLLKRLRLSRSLSQSDLVDLVIENNSRLVGLDVVTISRWENWVVVPTHKRQIEVFDAAFEPYYEYVVNNRDLVSNSFEAEKIKKSHVWENSSSVDLVNVSYQMIRSVDENGCVNFCILYTDNKNMPVGQITYKFISQCELWRISSGLNKANEYGAESEECILIDSMFSLSDKIVPHMLGLLINKLLLKEVSLIGFCSSNQKSSLKKFLKSIGFKIHKETKESTSLVLTYYDALYNKELFYCSVLIGAKGDIHAK